MAEMQKLDTNRSIFRTHREPADVKRFLEKAMRKLLYED